MKYFKITEGEATKICSFFVQFCTEELNFSLTYKLDDMISCGNVYFYIYCQCC